MALYDRDYVQKTAAHTETQAFEGGRVRFMKKTYQLLAASMMAAAVGAYVTMPFAAVMFAHQWIIWSIFGAELLVLFFGLSMSGLSMSRG